MDMSEYAMFDHKEQPIHHSCISCSLWISINDSYTKEVWYNMEP